jgi:hypothetical protein
MGEEEAKAYHNGRGEGQYRLSNGELHTRVVKTLITRREIQAR